MRFEVWFHNQAEPQRVVAERLGITKARVSQLISGDLPSLGLAFRIKEMTGGQVTPNDWAGAWRRNGGGDNG
jgi:DNA-binding transcriptional regulator YdaS (Cro superfamily)